MLSSLWRGNGTVERPLVASSAVELRDVDMFVYTHPAGLLGRWLGRHLKFKVDRFYFDYVKVASGGQGPPVPQLLRVRCAANSLLALSEVHGSDYRFDRVPLTFSECIKLDRRARINVLDFERFPEITFDVHKETAESVAGSLSLRGVTGLVTCLKQREGAELVVQCGLKQSTFGIPQYKILMGLFKVADNVDIEVRIPSHHLQRE